MLRPIQQQRKANLESIARNLIKQGFCNKKGE